MELKDFQTLLNDIQENLNNSDIVINTLDKIHQELKVLFLELKRSQKQIKILEETNQQLFQKQQYIEVEMMED